MKVVGRSSFDVYDVAYYYFNPQCNRCLAKLTNGEITDYSPSFIDLVWNEYEILDKKDVINKVTLNEIYAKFGRVVQIIDNNKLKFQENKGSLEINKQEAFDQVIRKLIDVQNSADSVVLTTVNNILKEYSVSNI